MVAVAEAGEMKGEMEKAKGDMKGQMEETKGEMKGMKEEAKGNDMKGAMERGKGNMKGAVERGKGKHETNEREDEGLILLNRSHFYPRDYLSISPSYCLITKICQDAPLARAGLLFFQQLVNVRGGYLLMPSNRRSPLPRRRRRLPFQFDLSSFFLATVPVPNEYQIGQGVS